MRGSQKPQMVAGVESVDPSSTTTHSNEMDSLRMLFQTRLRRLARLNVDVTIETTGSVILSPGIIAAEVHDSISSLRNRADSTRRIDVRAVILAQPMHALGAQALQQPSRSGKSENYSTMMYDGRLILRFSMTTIESKT